MLFQHRLFQVWKFSFKEKKRTSKEKLSFHRMPSGWVFFTEIEDHACVSNLIISMTTWRITLIDKYILRNIAGCY